jgi:NAD(P)-dependent dehydrogenase (short-subunit alcohol dehydrogenase family)
VSCAGKIALVTGAQRGIGRAIAVRFAEAGADVALNFLDDKAAAESAAAEIAALGRRATTIAADISKPEEARRLVADAERALGPIDVLVNNAGITLQKRALELTDEEWERILATNLTSMFRLARAVAPSMITRGGGKIINVGSLWGKIGVPQFLAYCVSKAGADALTRCLAVEWARHGIRVNCLAPGYIRTDVSVDEMANERTRKLILSRIPLRRLGEPDEVGRLAVYLASPASDFMTGQTIYLDGGQGSS